MFSVLHCSSSVLPCLSCFDYVCYSLICTCHNTEESSVAGHQSWSYSWGLRFNTHEWILLISTNSPLQFLSHILYLIQASTIVYRSVGKSYDHSFRCRTFKSLVDDLSLFLVILRVYISLLHFPTQVLTFYRLIWHVDLLINYHWL